MPHPTTPSSTIHRTARAGLVLLATLATLLAVPTGAQAATLGCADDASGVVDLQAWAPSMLAATNAHRAGLGLVALRLDATLTKASLWKARDLARRDYFAHDDPASGAAPARSPWERLAECGFPDTGSRAENIAAGQQSGPDFITAWINSPGHRANIENASMRYVGFGVSSSDGSTYGTYAVQMFSSVPGPAVDPPRTIQEQQPTDDGATGGGGGGTPTRATSTLRGGVAITRQRCRGRAAVRGWCYRIVVRGSVRAATARARSARRVTVTRRLASGRFVRVGIATTRGDGSFVLRRIVRPTRTATGTWLRRNARVVRLTAPGTSAGTRATRTLVARVRL